MAAPRSLGKYRLLAELGRGGMATVYLAAHTGPGGFRKLVVVKELLPELAQELEFRDMFLDEARIAARLSHPNVVQTFEVGEEGGAHFIVMEYLEGQPFSNVRARLGREKKLGLADHVRVLADALEGLHAAHEAKDFDGRPLGVVHRDVSPHNVFVTYAGEVKVVDFGIAKAATSSQHTRTGVIKGKISYMAPEQALGAPVDRRADVFAAGVMLWEALAERRLWKDMPDPGILHHLSTGEIPRVRDSAPGADPILEAACARALAPDPGERYATAAELRAELVRFLERQAPRPAPRAFGGLVAESFAQERERIARTIERQMELSSSGHFELAKIDEQAPSTATSAATPHARLDAQPSAPPEKMTASGALAIETGPRIATAPPPGGRSRAPLAVAAGVAVAVAIAAGAAFVATHAGPSSAGARATASTSASTSATATAAPTVAATASASATPSAAASASASAKPAATPRGPRPPPKPTSDIILTR